MTLGPHDVGRPLVSALAVLMLAAGCAGTASVTRTMTPTLPPAARAAVSPAPTLAKPSPAPVPTLPPPAHRPQTIHVLEDPIAFHTVKVPGCTSTAGCKGDELKGASRMVDAATHDVVGRLAVECVLLDPRRNLYHCPANTITLTGRGQIIFDETVYIGGRWYPKPWPIISGTGEFLGATGSVTSPEDSTWSFGDFVITIDVQERHPPIHTLAVPAAERLNAHRPPGLRACRRVPQRGLRSRRLVPESMRPRAVSLCHGGRDGDPERRARASSRDGR